MRFILGLVLGALIGGAGVAASSGPKIIGGDGYLMDIVVEDSEGDEICSAPYYSSGFKSVSCE